MPEQDERSQHRTMPDQAELEFLRRRAAAELVHVELYPGRSADGTVVRFMVQRPDPTTYRATILLHPAYSPSPLIVGFDGSRDDAAKFLKTHGVPVLRVGGKPRPSF